ncbi:hypothetical protein QFZ75_002880 [Streptomyces sp. V3I8]|uniref:hypothetical protein n=1 Tax=Streptomyces sp. V3I8 TaxID=3042279 RepID=UPI00278B1FB7|nr:hypothetical protein [Streptomyces sp. V3I8]MDQ1036464.1 hypothetical protein [Streptomyces sp. V3I8]
MKKYVLWRMRRRIGLKMRVEIPVELFKDREGNENTELVLKLIRFFREARHEWVLSPRDVDVVREFFLRHVPTFAQVYTLLAQKTSGKSYAWAPRGVSSGVVGVSRETLRSDVHDLERPALLVVENASYDWKMIKALASLLGCEDIVRAEEDNRLEVYNGGGKDGATRLAVEQLAKFTRTKRVVLVIDSDSFHPGERTDNHEKANIVELKGGRTHVLRFREMENYIPNRVLARQARKPSAQAGMAKRLESLKKLSADQRAHFDMKYGFRAKSTRDSAVSERKPRHRKKVGKTFDVPPRHRDLYADVHERDLVILCEGFGTDLPTLLFQEVRAGGISEVDLDGLGLGAPQELRSMFDKIRNVI